jgi:hypothetical protein
MEGGGKGTELGNGGGGTTLGIGGGGTTLGIGGGGTTFGMGGGGTTLGIWKSFDDGGRGGSGGASVIGGLNAYMSAFCWKEFLVSCLEVCMLTVGLIGVCVFQSLYKLD